MRFQATEINIPEVDMTPMIDIVFQLLTFFMLVSSFDNLKADERVKLPENPMSKPPEVAREKELLLNIGFIRNDKGEKTNPNPLLFYAGEELQVPQWGAIIQREKRLYKDLGVKPEDVTVVIRADKEVPTGEIQELMKLCQQPLNANVGGFQKFALKAMSEAAK
ncbi:MAG: biopolymer transporter ExbD [Planctomycetes bacterium]|nr:biopolymer transporter ExbD [Planctomycetota bacterium]